MSRVIGCALDFLLDVLDYSPEETHLPASYDALANQLSADPLQKEYWAIILWNDEKHSYDEAVAHLRYMTGCNQQQATAVVLRADEEVKDLLMSANILSNSDLGQRCHRSGRRREEAT
jgi:E3 ubiquitin-protein ligase UBR1